MTWLFVIFGILIVLILALMFCVAPGKMTSKASKTAMIFKGLNCAHRGLHTEDQKVPENSIESFVAAKDGNYGIEIDVQLSKDGKVVVFHDDDLKRVCGIDANVNSKNWNELSRIPLFNTDQHIPLLSEVLDIIDDMPVIVELKSAGANNAMLCEETFKLLSEKGKNFCIESFDPRVGAWFKKNAPDVLRGQLSSSPRLFKGISIVFATLLGNLLTNFISRPHFIAYSNSTRPLIARLCYIFKPMKVTWTIIPGHNIEKCERQNDTVIFEYYKPKPRFK
ncbi:MAG: glycerophosphodiester phosphodiesterase [Oscillospiraceae bacterium]|nr:glycerophosphodiester phosphodiesterase [Oscillospiraceae bacterium]